MSPVFSDVFIAVGILVGPSVLGWVSADDQVDLLAQLGIALLLFVVGLKLDLHIIRTMGPVALATGLGQVIFTSVVGYFIAIVLGMTPVTALYVAVALTFSSTIIIVKLLSDKHEVDTLHGRIAIGFLIVQDVVVVVVMIGLTALGEAGDAAGLGREALEVLVKGGLFIAAIGLLMRYVLTPLLNQLARSPELLVLFAIAWAVSLGAAGVHLGFSKEVGAFLAGVSLASTPYREAIGARLVSLRDFLLLFFFIDLGAGLELAMLGAQVAPAILPTR
jgi:Kef-type K+ transport system membrane component KefB